MSYRREKLWTKTAIQQIRTILQIILIPKIKTVIKIKIRIKTRIQTNPQIRIQTKLLQKINLQVKAVNIKEQTVKRTVRSFL